MFSARWRICKPCRVQIETERAKKPEVAERIAKRRKAEYLARREERRAQQAIYYKAIRNKRIGQVAEYQSKPEVVIARAAYGAKRYLQKREALRAQQRTYYLNNKATFIAREAKRRALEIRAMPRWADAKAMSAIYREASTLTKKTGVQHHVDHIVPLVNKTVCGLHTESNLRVITASENLKKKNKHIN